VLTAPSSLPGNGRSGAGVAGPFIPAPASCETHNKKSFLQRRRDRGSATNLAHSTLPRVLPPPIHARQRAAASCPLARARTGSWATATRSAARSRRRWRRSRARASPAWRAARVRRPLEGGRHALTVYAARVGGGAGRGAARDGGGQLKPLARIAVRRGRRADTDTLTRTTILPQK
jgi:hypothetical protein